MIRGSLYGGRDPVGYVLSVWRTRVVLGAVKGFVVDLACGDNRIVRAHGRGQGVDIDARGQDDVLVALDFSHLPFESGSVDCVSIVASLNYFENATCVLREVRRILKSDGRLVLTMSNPTVMHYWHKLRDRWVRRAAVTEGELVILLRDSGLVLQQRRPFMLGVNTLFVASPNSSELPDGAPHA